MTDPATTILKYMTDGTLLREVMNEPLLQRYSTIIIDEGHERTLASDVLMGVLKGIVVKRPDFKIIIMSATLNASKFQKFFSIRSNFNVPLLEIPGRTHPVLITYTKKPESNYVDAAILTVLRIHYSEDPGNTLVFLPGEADISTACRRIELGAGRLENENPESVGPLVCIPSYSSLPDEQQQRIFDPPPAPHIPGGPSGRKVIVSTNIAETSLTIDGIVYVVDSGVSKQKVYEPLARVEYLNVKPISKACAQQRAGRAGRTRPGKCFRMYTKKEFIKLENQFLPEILRRSSQFRLCGSPLAKLLQQALEQLKYLKAIDNDGKLTRVGGMMADFPLDPQLAKMLILSPKFDCSKEILTITAMLSVPNVWLRPSEQKIEADAARARLTVPDGDHLTLMNVYKKYMRNKHDKNWALENFLCLRSLEEAENVQAQLQQIMGRFDIKVVSTVNREQRSVNVRKALVGGFFMQVAHKIDSLFGSRYAAATVKDRAVTSLHPSCSIKSKPDFVIFNEFICTTAPFLRIVSEVNPAWLIELAPHYYHITSLPEGETKRAFLRAFNIKCKTKGRKNKRER